MVRTDWDAFWMDIAARVATRSKDPSTQVGCVVVDERNRVLGVGYNGFPRGVTDDPTRYADRDLKHSMVLHAEENALLNSKSFEDTNFARLYCTLFPCSHCMAHIIQSPINVAEIVAPRPDHEGRPGANYWASAQMAQEAGVILSFPPAQETEDG